MSYKHDIFISYKRDPLKDEWLSEHFIPLFVHIAREEITAKCKRLPGGIFFDQTEVSGASRKFDQSGLEPGQAWKDALEDALKTSRCMVALLSPLYFYSEWCMIEWRSFRDRSKTTGRPIVVPMSVHDGDAFPQEAQDLQAPDFSDYVIIGAGFKETKAYPEFQRHLRAFARTVADRVANAPNFSQFSLAAANVIPPPPAVPQQRL